MRKDMIMIALCLPFVATGCDSNKGEPTLADMAHLDAYKPMGGTDTPMTEELEARAGHGAVVRFDAGDDLLVRFDTDTDFAELVRSTQLRIRRPMTMRFANGHVELIEIPETADEEPIVYGRFECTFKMDPVRQKNVMVLTLKQVDPEQEAKSKGLFSWIE